MHQYWDTDLAEVGVPIWLFSFDPKIFFKLVCFCGFFIQKLPILKVALNFKLLQNFVLSFWKLNWNQRGILLVGLFKMTNCEKYNFQIKRVREILFLLIIS